MHQSKEKQPLDTLRKQITKESGKPLSPRRKSKVLPNVYMRSSSSLSSLNYLPRDVSHRLDSTQRSRSSFESMEEKLREILGIQMKTHALPSTLDELSQFLQNPAKADPNSQHFQDLDYLKLSLSSNKDKFLEKVIQEGGLLHRTQSGLLQPQLCKLYDQVVQKTHGQRSELARSGVELGVPSSRKEVEVLIAWLEQMSKTYLEDENLTVGEKVRRAQLIYTACFREVVRQVSVQCVERGVLMQRIWNASVDLNSLQEDQRNKQIKELQDKIQEVIQGSLNDLKTRCEKAEKCAEDLKLVIRDKDQEIIKNSLFIQIDQPLIKPNTLQVETLSKTKSKRLTSFNRKKPDKDTQTSFIDQLLDLQNANLELLPKSLTVLVGYFDESGLFFKQQAMQVAEETVKSKTFFNEITEIAKKVDVQVNTEEPEMKELRNNEKHLKNIVVYVRAQQVSTQFPESKLVLQVCKLFDSKIFIKPSKVASRGGLEERSLTKNLQLRETQAKPDQETEKKLEHEEKRFKKGLKKNLRTKSKVISPGKVKKSQPKLSLQDNLKLKKGKFESSEELEKDLIELRSRSQLKNYESENFDLEKKDKLLKSPEYSTPIPSIPKDSVIKKSSLQSSQMLSTVYSQSAKPPVYPNNPESSQNISNQVKSTVNPTSSLQPSEILYLINQNQPKESISEPISSNKPSENSQVDKAKHLKPGKSKNSPLPKQSFTKSGNQSNDSKSLRTDLLKAEKEASDSIANESLLNPSQKEKTLKRLKEKASQTELDAFLVGGLTKSEILSFIRQLNKLLKDLQSDARKKTDLQKDLRGAERAGKLIRTLENLFLEKNPKKSSDYGEMLIKAKADSEVFKETLDSQDSQRLKNSGKSGSLDSRPSTLIDEFNLGIIHRKNMLNHPGQKLFTQVLQSLPSSSSLQPSISLKALIKIINSVNSEKQSLCKDNPSYLKYDTSMILYDFFINKYGLKTVSENKFKQVVVSTIALKASNFRVFNFSKFLGIDSNYVAEDWNFYLSLFELLDYHNFGVNVASDLNHFSSITSINFCIRQFFEGKLKDKEIEEVLKIAADLVDAEFGKNQKTDLVNTDRFLHEVLQAYSKFKVKVYGLTGVEALG